MESIPLSPCRESELRGGWGEGVACSEWAYWFCTWVVLRWEAACIADDMPALGKHAVAATFVSDLTVIIQTANYQNTGVTMSSKSMRGTNTCTNSRVTIVKPIQVMMSFVVVCVLSAEPG